MSFLSVGLVTLISAGGERVPFRYGWRFHYGPGSDDAPGPGQCSFKDASRATCTNLEHNPNRFTPDDCRLGCCYEPTCLVWQQSGKACLWGGADSVCTGGNGSAPQAGKPPSGPPVGGQRPAFQPVKTDYAFGAAGLDDSTWQAVDIPHDSLLNGTFTDSGDVHHGFLPRNVSWYRKAFALPEDGRVWMIEFEGTFHFTQIWVNGVHVLDHSLGYTAYALRVDNLAGIKRGTGSKNVISIRTDASYGSGHWYEGGGLRWDINLVRYNTTHIVRHGAFVTPQVRAQAQTGIPALLEIVTEPTDGAPSRTMRSLDGLSAVFEGVGLGSCTARADASQAGTGDVIPLRCTLKPTAPLSLWSVKTPTLYTITVTLFDGADAVDTQTLTTGFRNAQFSSATGVSLNGEGFKYRGFSHHDSFAGVGTAMPPRFDLFRAQASRAVGSNVWRMSHNPYHPPLYDILDAIGTTVWDENRDLGPWYAAGMGQMVRRDRNHPAVLLWSFCNEFECGQNSPKTGYAFRNASLQQDTSRPLTSNANGAYITGVDVQGFSHSSADKLNSFHSQNPKVPIVLSECCSCSSHRLPVTDRAPAASCIREQNSPGLLPFDTGSLGVWTLFDYFGESHTWPDYACAFGQFDIAGSPKPHAYWYVVNWLQLINATDAGRPTVPKQDVARVLDLADQLPCSSDEAGISCTVTGISTAATNELFVDGVSQGVQTPAVPGDQVQWTFPATLVTAIDATCSFPVNLSSLQCKGLSKQAGVHSADACRDSCCDGRGCTIWQFNPSSGCWTGFGRCNPNEAPKVQWVGGGTDQPLPPGPPGPPPPGPPPMPVNISNVTMVARNASGKAVATHTITASKSGTAARLVAIAEIPSISTGTGSKLVLDGTDSGLVAVKLVDTDGIVLTSDAVAVSVTFSVESGPGRLLGVGSGNPGDHAYQRGTTVATYGGTAKAMIQVSVDCTSSGRDLALLVDVDNHKRTTVVPSSASCDEFTKQVIVIKATAGNLSATVNVATSDDVGTDGYLAVARSTADNLDAYSYMRDFVG